jgi:hypothetical protein
MGKHVAPEKFVVGETVEFYQGEYRSTVTVFAVNGDEVTAGSHREIADVFVPRSDGKHVVKGTPDFAHMPTMIFHTPESAPVLKPATFWQRITGKVPA